MNTPNMNLPISTVGVDTGLTWETNLNAAQSIIDGHNHTSGNGVQIPVAGISIQTSLPMNNNSLVGTQAITFVAQAAVSVPLSVYAIGNDLYYTDGNGNVIRMTAGGLVNATSSGIASGTASASFSSGVLVVNAASLTPANIQVASVLLGLNSSGTNYLTLSPPSSLSSGAYTLTLPAVAPGAGTYYLQIDTLGNITPVAKPTTNYAISSSSGSGTFTTSLSYVNVPNLSQTITTSGGPVRITLQSAVTGVGLSIAASSGVAQGIVAYLRGGSIISGDPVSMQASGTLQEYYPYGCFSYLDTPSAGTYTYSIQMKVNNGTSGISMDDCVLVVEELN